MDAERAPGFLARWASRKLAKSRGQDSPPEPERPEASIGPAGLDREQATERVLTDADMPPLESLDASSDFSGFLSEGVSRDLRRRALAKLFHAPDLNVTDGLEDYAEDFTSFKPLGDLVTVDMRHRMEVAARRLLAEAEETDPGARRVTCEAEEQDATGDAEPTGDGHGRVSAAVHVPFPKREGDPS